MLEFSIINLDKPSGPTSFEVDEKIKAFLGLNKTSHFGTLDPMVTGVLPIALGRACRLMKYFIGKNKNYIGIMHIHKETSKEVLEKEIQNFILKITQLPPVKSRVKRQERERTIHTFKILEIQGKDILFETEVEAGTYIRKLIHDLGEKIGGAHMIELRRTKASIFDDENLVTLYQLKKAIEEYKKGNEKILREILIPGEIISEILPVIQIKKKYIDKLQHGSPLMKEHLEKSSEKLTDEEIAVFCKEEFIGVFKITNEKDIIARPEYVFQPIK